MLLIIWLYISIALQGLNPWVRRANCCTIHTICSATMQHPTSRWSLWKHVRHHARDTMIAHCETMKNENMSMRSYVNVLEAKLAAARKELQLQSSDASHMNMLNLALYDEAPISDDCTTCDIPSNVSSDPEPLQVQYIYIYIYIYIYVKPIIGCGLNFIGSGT